MLISPFAIVLLLLVGVVFVWWLLMLVEALRIPTTTWEAHGQNQLIYVIAMIFLGVVGTLLYVLIPRKVLPRP